MTARLLATKLYIPPPRARVVVRPRLTERLNEGLKRRPSLTVISAPAGFGKTTLVSEWITGGERPVAWLSLDDADNDLALFLAYFIAALQTVAPSLGQETLALLHAPGPPPATAVLLTPLLNEIATFQDQLVVVLDDYHAIETKAVDDVLTFVIEHLPPPLHLVVTTREDPRLPLARLRARGQLTELRAADLRFTPAEAGDFLNAAMGLSLPAEHIAALEQRTEGWIAGLQLAALSMQGHQDISGFIHAFTGSHHFVLDYLVEEVLQQQPEPTQSFLLHTSILERMCGPLCEAVLLTPPGSGQATLEAIERANLFIVPLDSERRWFRYHHLFADLLRRRLGQRHGADPVQEAGAADQAVDALHRRASQWYEDQGLELEAFHHATTGQDIERAERLIEGKGIPLHYRVAAAPVLAWLKSLPTRVLNARPALWVTYATTLMFSGQNTAVEEKLQAAEAVLGHRGIAPDEQNRDLIGRIAALRATAAVIQQDAQAILTQSRRALEYLNPDNLTIRTTTTWTLGYAYQLQGDRAAASRAYREVIAISQSAGYSIYTLAATLSLGQVQEADNQLHAAAASYRRALELAGDPPQRMAGEVQLGLARVCYEWNDLAAAAQHAEQCAELARSMVVETFAKYGVILARLKLAQGDVPAAVAALAEAEAFLRRHNFMFRMPDVAAVQVLALLRQGQLAAATQLAETHQLPLGRARVLLAQGDPVAALAVLAPLCQQVEAKDQPDGRLKVLVLQALALQAQGETAPALVAMGEALALAEPGGFIRTFVDEGPAMASLLREVEKRGIAQGYAARILAGFEPVENGAPITQRLSEPLSDREREVLSLLGSELDGPAIARELNVSMNTLRTHTKNIYTKLGVNNRRAAVRQAEELELS
ncbi:MAG: LuxR family transcriptional regulator [Anaerolineales bacterium]|nr:LuxR family transcriptional regulator [Anaerolineales bacterium]